jgi:hypothetical protein
MDAATIHDGFRKAGASAKSLIYNNDGAACGSLRFQYAGDFS